VKKISLSRSEAAIVVGAMLIVTAALTLAMLLYVNRDNRWVRINSPANDKAVEIVAITRLLQPYVLTEGGNYYFCSGGEWDQPCRPVRADGVPTCRIPGRWQTCEPVFPALPPLPGETVNTLDVGQCQEGRTYARLALLADGSIWKWQRTFSWVPRVAVLSTFLWGLVLGALAGLGIVWAHRYLSAPVAPASGGRKPSRDLH
jgi:hypothetical protein